VRVPSPPLVLFPLWLFTRSLYCFPFLRLWGGPPANLPLFCAGFGLFHPAGITQSPLFPILEKNGRGGLALFLSGHHKGFCFFTFYFRFLSPVNCDHLSFLPPTLLSFFVQCVQEIQVSLKKNPTAPPPPPPLNRFPPPLLVHFPTSVVSCNCCFFFQRHRLVLSTGLELLLQPTTGHVLLSFVLKPFKRHTSGFSYSSIAPLY